MKNSTIISLTIILSQIFNIVLAQPSYPPPSGIFCSCPPTISTSGTGSVVPSVAAKSFVNGILVRIGWKDIEPVDNSYNWALLDNQIAVANTYGKKISLAIGGGPNTPSWLYTLGVPTYSYSVPFSGTIPIIWNTTFINKWTEFISALGNHYKNDTTIVLVYITNATTNGYEMQMPYSPTPSYSSSGYADSKVIDSWKQVIDTFLVAFPDHYLTNDFHPVNSSNAIADSIYNYTQIKIGGRYGANAWWWTQNNTSVYPSQYTILQNSAIQNTFTGVQMAYSGTSDSAMFGSGGMPAALQLAISKEICYWEIWNQDLLNNNFASMFSTISCSSPSGIVASEEERNDFGIYPNPASTNVNIVLNQQLFNSVKLMNKLGQVVYYTDNINSSRILIDVSKLEPGLYFLVATDKFNKLKARKLIITH